MRSGEVFGGGKMTPSKSNNLHGTNCPLEDTPSTMKGSVNATPRDVRAIRTDSSSEQLPESAFANYNIDPVITGPEEDYDLICPINSFSNKKIFRARGQRSGREVVIKRFLEDHNYLREKEIQELLKKHGGHENILLADEFQDDQRIMVSPFIKGGDVWRFQKKINRLLKPRQVKDIFSGLCDALRYLHELNIIHRDVKSSNLVLDNSSQSFMPPTPRLFDYELGWHETVTPSQLENPTSVAGTSYFISPERWFGIQNDPRSDIYAAGITLYQLLTGGYLPFIGTTTSSVMQQHIQEPVPQLIRYNPRASADLQSIVEKALAKDPDQRYQTAADLKRDYLEVVENDLAVEIDVTVGE